MTVALGSAGTIADRRAHPKSDAEAPAILLLAVPGSLPLPSGCGSRMIWGSFLKEFASRGCRVAFCSFIKPARRQGAEPREEAARVGGVEPTARMSFFKLGTFNDNLKTVVAVTLLTVYDFGQRVAQTALQQFHNRYSVKVYGDLALDLYRRAGAAECRP